MNVFHGRYNIPCGTNCKYRTAAPLCTLCFTYVTVNTVRTGDSKDNNNNSNAVTDTETAVPTQRHP